MINLILTLLGVALVVVGAIDLIGGALILGIVLVIVGLVLVGAIGRHAGYLL